MYAQQPSEEEIGKITLSQLDSLREVINKYYVEMDSLRKQRQIDSLETLWYKARMLLRSAHKYDAVLFTGQLSQAKLGRFNEDLQRAGLPPVSDSFGGFGYGAALKRNRFLHEIYLFLLFGNKQENDNVKVKVDGGNIINYQLGFDILNQKRIQLYPFIGFNQNLISIDYLKKGSLDSGTTLESINGKYNRSFITKGEWHVNAGGQVDYHLTYSPFAGGIIVSVKYGISQPVIEGSYKIDGKKVPYDPQINLRDSFWAVNVKFYWRR